MVLAIEQMLHWLIANTVKSPLPVNTPARLVLTKAATNDEKFGSAMAIPAMVLVGNNNTLFITCITPLLAFRFAYITELCPFTLIRPNVLTGK